MGFLFLACTPAPCVRASAHLLPCPRARPPARPPRPRPHQAMHTTARRPTYTNQLAQTNAHQAMQTNELADQPTPTNSHQPTRTKQCTQTSNAHQRIRANQCTPTHTMQRTPTNAQQACAFGPPRFCVEGSSLLAPKGAKPWRGRTLEGSGGGGACGRVVTFGPEIRETLVGAYYSEGSGGGGARFWTPAVLCGRVVTFGLKGRETVAGAYFRGLWR